MNLFSSLSEKLNHVFSKIAHRGRLTELEIRQTMREIRVVLLEADVNFLVAKNLVSRITEKAVGENVLNSLTPSQQVIKIVRDELTELMGGHNSKLMVSSSPPTVILMCGLQGAGKTIMCGKLGLYLKKQSKKPLLVACDIYRPAAINQLKVVGKTAGVEVFEMGQQDPVKIAKAGVAHARRMGFDTVIIDTAGRLQINQELMNELVAIKNEVKPTEILLAVDSMTGQQAADIAKEFNEKLGITGSVLTKLDGDTRGGAALSIVEVTGKPIKFTGVGEKIGDLEPFYPDRMASRILGMGDVLSLIEKAEQNVSLEDMKQMQEKMMKNSFTLDDFLKQFDQLSKMGNINDLIAMVPGISNQLKGQQVDESKIKTFKAIIQSMTKKERQNPEVIKASNKKRIAKGSGTTIQEVNMLLKQFDQTKNMMKNLKNNKLMRIFK